MDLTCSGNMGEVFHFSFFLLLSYIYHQSFKKSKKFTRVLRASHGRTKAVDPIVDSHSSSPSSSSSSSSSASSPSLSFSSLGSSSGITTLFKYETYKKIGSLAVDFFPMLRGKSNGILILEERIQKASKFPSNLLSYPSRLSQVLRHPSKVFRS